MKAAGTADVIDAHVALLVDDGDHILTSDAKDFERIIAARGVAATIVDV